MAPTIHMLKQNKLHELYIYKNSFDQTTRIH